MGDPATRIAEELELLRKWFGDIQFEPTGNWFLIPNDARASVHGWSPKPFPVAFHAQPGHPGAVPYGIYVRSDARVGSAPPANFEASASNRPPFPGEWGVLSWSIDGWFAKADVREGSNLLGFVLSFEERYRSGP